MKGGAKTEWVNYHNFPNGGQDLGSEPVVDVDVSSSAWGAATPVEANESFVCSRRRVGFVPAASCVSNMNAEAIRGVCPV